MMYTIHPYEIADLKLEPADPLIPTVIIGLQQLMQNQLIDVLIEHIGSTAVPDMPGRNSINLQLLIEQDRFNQVVKQLEGLGFASHPFVSDQEHPVRVGKLFHNNKPYSIHLLLTEPGSPYHQNAVFFRDYLRSHSDVQEAYAELKRSVIESGADHAAYRESKNQFIESILKLRQDFTE
jgi:dephospho-CoA kinase